jgi:hypothetical protein
VETPLPGEAKVALMQFIDAVEDGDFDDALIFARDAELALALAESLDNQAKVSAQADALAFLGDAFRAVAAAFPRIAVERIEDIADITVRYIGQLGREVEPEEGGW